ncbi:MAG: hypothetical protein SOZ58_09960 [Prevotella sp.]|nr:hypothetical protein [Prevotella sp.]
MKKIYFLAMFMLLMTGSLVLTSCSSDDEPFTTATEDDEPRILDPYFPDWTDGQPGVFKNFARDLNLEAEVIVTPANYTTVTWFIDDEQVAEGRSINHSLLAGEYTLKVVATTTKGKETSRISLVQVRPLDGDPNPGDDIRDRQVVPGSVVKLHGTNMDKVTKISFGDKEAATTFVDKGDKSYVEYTVPADLALGTYRITLTNSEGNVYGGGKIEISNEAPEVTEETLWEGSFDVTWGTPFDLLKDQFPSLVKAGNIVRAYVNGNGQGTMTTAWWNNILTGKGDPERGDIMISGSAVLEYEITDFSIQLMNEQNGVLFVGDGYTITKITKE